jgi:squalene cyclase
MMNKPAAFIVVENGQTWLRTSAETEEAIRTGFIMETVPLYTAPQKCEPLSDEEIADLWANKSPANEFECVRLVEKAHGIGGGE